MKNNKYLFIMEYLIALIIYSTVAFYFFDTEAPNFWTAYIFALIAFVINMIGLIAFFNHGALAFFGISIMAVSWVFLIAQVILSFIFMLVTVIPNSLVLVVEIMLFCIHFVIVIAAMSGMSYQRRLEEKAKVKKRYMESLRNDVLNIADLTKNKIVQKKLRQFAEKVAYSDPMSHDALLPVEHRLEEMLTHVAESIDNGNDEESIEIIEQMQRVLAERNRRCSLLK